MWTKITSAEQDKRRGSLFQGFVCQRGYTLSGKRIESQESISSDSTPCFRGAENTFFSVGNLIDISLVFFQNLARSGEDWLKKKELPSPRSKAFGLSHEL